MTEHAWQIERLDRGVVAVPAIDGGNLVSWRLLATDAATVGFNLYRDGVKLNAAPLTGATNYRDTAGSATAARASAVAVRTQSTYAPRTGSHAPAAQPNTARDGEVDG